MLKERAGVVRKANIVADAAIIVMAFLAAFGLRTRLGGPLILDQCAWGLLVVVPVWLVLLDRHGFYSSMRMENPRKILRGVSKVTALGGAITGSLIYLLAPASSRGLFVSFLGLSWLMLICEQLLVRFVLRILRLEGYNSRNILVVGTGESAEKTISILDHNKGWGYKVIGVLHTGQNPPAGSVLGHPVLGPLADLTEFCKTHTVDEVLFCASKDEAPFALVDHIASLHEMGITARTMLNVFNRVEGQKEIGMLHNEVPMITFRAVSADANQLFFKRCLDIVGSCAGLAFSACLFPFIAIAIKLESPGPLFFGQTRVGENGRTFTCWKFRSMYQDAEARKQELMHLNEMEGAIFKIKNDPRVTRVGAFLRKTSLDELPQFWNVLIGEMSLVGTRPPTPAEVENYDNWQRKRICIKPGITGLWQVSGRNSVTDFDEVVRLDLQYIEGWSIATDLRLLLRTLKVVLFREGAC